MKIGTRVVLDCATDAWMQGDRYGVVIGLGRARPYIDTFTGEVEKRRPLKVKMDKSGRTLSVHPGWVYEIEGVGE